MYKRYVVDLRNKPVTLQEVRQRVFNLLSELTALLDWSNGGDIQLVNLSLTVTAAEGGLASAEAKVKDAGVGWRVEDEDF